MPGWIAATFAAGLVAVASGSGCARAAKLSAADIVAKNAAARGGLDAWRKVETMIWVGRIESAHAPAPSMPFELQQKRPNKTRLQINSPAEKSVRTFDGVHGWRLRSTHGQPQVQPYTPQEARFAQTGHGIDGPLIDYAAKRISVTLEGVDEVAGRKAYHFSVHPPRGGSEEVWVDAETYLEIRYDRMADGPVGAPRRVSVNYGDYRTVDGLQIPFLIETAGTPPDKMQIEKVTLNAPLDDSTFENPTAPHLRNRRWPTVAPRAPAPSTAANMAHEQRGSAPR